MSHFWEDDIVGTKPARDETAGLPMYECQTFVDAMNRTHALAMDALGLPRTVSTASMPGAGQQSRDEARERATRGSADAYRRILDALATGGMTRKELAEATGLQRDSVNGRVAELRDQGRVYTEGRRGGESIVHRREAA